MFPPKFPSFESKDWKIEKMKEGMLLIHQSVIKYHLDEKGVWNVGKKAKILNL